jgi:lysozyme
MNVSEKCLKIIKHFEGCRLKAYRCSAGVLTIGYGHTGNVHISDVITQEQAEKLLKLDVERFSVGVKKLVKVDLNQNQFDALVSFAFNVGLGNLGKSTLLKLLNKGDYTGAAGEFWKWRKAGGVVSSGLERRRAAEADLFIGVPCDRHFK